MLIALAAVALGWYSERNRSAAKIARLTAERDTALLENHSFVELKDSVICVKSSHPKLPRIKEEWDALSKGTRKQIQEICLRQGLSSTGIFELSEIYEHSDDGTQNRLFHLIQKDLMGERLYWSILVDPDQRLYRMNFYINRQEGSAIEWHNFTSEQNAP